MQHSGTPWEGQGQVKMGLTEGVCLSIFLSIQEQADTAMGPQAKGQAQREVFQLSAGICLVWTHNITGQFELPFNCFRKQHKLFYLLDEYLEGKEKPVKKQYLISSLS